MLFRSASFVAGAESYVDCEFHPTVAEGTAIKRPLRIVEMLIAIRESKGGTVAVPEEDIIKTAFKLAQQGIYVEPTCAHAAAAFEQLIASGTIDRSEQTVIILTGTGNKATQFYETAKT